MVLFIVSALIAVVALGVGIYLTANFIKNIMPKVTYNVLVKRLLIISGVFALAFTTMMISIYLWAKISPAAY